MYSQKTGIYVAIVGNILPAVKKRRRVRLNLNE
jgi:hypothetical protein